MNSIRLFGVLILLPVGFSALSADLSAAQEPLPLSARSALSKLENRILSTDDGEALAKVPGITPHLVAVIAKIIDENGDFEHLAYAFQFLRQVHNIPSDDLAPIRKRLLPLLNLPVRSGLARIMRGQSLYLLGENPSADNENLIITFLNESVPENSTDYSFFAAAALGIHGGPEALAALESYQKRHPWRADLEDNCADFAARSIDKIQKRLLAAGSLQKSPEIDNEKQVWLSEGHGTSYKGKQASPLPGTLQATIAAGLIIFAGGLLWWFKKRK